MRHFPGLAALVLAFGMSGAPALASEADGKSVLDGDYITVGAGAIYGPSYDGSDDYVVSPIPIVRGSFRGIAISPRPAGVALDFIPDAKDARFGFQLGPVATISRNRAVRIEDPVVRAAGKLDTAVELGVSGGVSAYQVLNAYDALTLSGDVQWDVAGAHKGMIWSPSISYATPVSKALLVTLLASARHVDDDYARYYYSVTPAQSAASGLPEYQAEGGWDSVTGGVLIGWDLSGDLRDGGLALFTLASYSRMLNDASETPYTALRGDADQWLIGGGLAYTF
ncbi:MltA-interacting MipA family protein [Novosphingobium endophyticum]|uniref:MltA-interacting MipA family protein n=1 Tax=Novosphingobium endophyticum TaxID=1955250 RepID=A0A916TUH0_9SPHN|nr:MipA/OmpV family protein [Novosphingobium endophyticum]GGC05558.1 MltA-interacting MipA family protein [Novosphingobium endophyticum]